MFRLSSAGVWWCALLMVCTSCSEETVVVSKGGFELVQTGADSVLHQPGNLQLWHHPSSGKRSLVWSYVVGSPEVLDGLVVFSGGLTDDRRWKVYPAVLAYKSGGLPVDITELVTKKYYDGKAMRYALAREAFRYNVQSASNGRISVLGSRLPEADKNLPVSIEVELTAAEVEEWIKSAQSSGHRTVYRGTEFIVLKVAETD